MRLRVTTETILGLLLTLVVAGQVAPGITAQAALPTAAAQPTEITEGLDGIWFTEFAANKVGRYDPVTHEITEYIVPTPNSGPLGITTGGTGEIWFTEFTAGKIAMINSAGVITEYTIPTPASAPVGISGATGSIWFTESATNKIGHLTPAGFTETIIPTPASLPMGVIVDGISVWFTEFQGNKIGRLAASGAITEVAIPTPNAGPTNLSSSSGGGVWFAESTGGRIGVLNQGTITEYPLPGQRNPTRVSTDSGSGNVWFTEQAGNKIGLLTSAGVFTQYPIPGILTEYPVPTPGSEPVGIVAGFLDNIFFVERAGNAIGSFHQDAVAFIATRGVAGWTTEFDVANTEERSVNVHGAQVFTPYYICPGVCPPTIVLNLPGHGAGTASGSRAVASGDFAAVFFHTLEDGILPGVRARLVNPSAIARSIDLPGIRLSTLSALGMAPLVFPSALRTAAGGHSNLLLAEFGSGSGLRLGDAELRAQVAAFAADGQLFGSSAFTVSSGGALYLVDVLGKLGVNSAQQAQIRVTQTGGRGLLWGYLITVADDGDIGISTGATP